MKFNTLTRYQQNQLVLSGMATGVAVVGLIVGGVVMSSFPTLWIGVYNTVMGALLQFGISPYRAIKKDIRRIGR